MKLLMRSVGALALLAGALSVSGTKILTPNPPSLLGVHQETGVKDVSLDGTTDKLQGVLDAVTVSVNQVRAGLTKIKGSCAAEVQASSKRVAGQKLSVADLETSRQINLERTAGLEASLANLVGQETDAHASYESSVSQRAKALQTHLTAHKSNSDQATAIGGVLEMMKQKRAQVTASQTSTKDMKVVPPTAPTSSGSGLDFVIGVLDNIKSTSTAKAEEGAEKQNDNDADLEKLVTSYKTSLQHIDKQYQTENARRMEAKVTARDALEEKKLRNLLVDGEDKLDEEFFGLCGADGKGGSVAAASAAAEYLLSQFKQQSANAISIMDTLPDLKTGAASSFLSSSIQLRGAPSAANDVLDMAKSIKSRVSATPVVAPPSAMVHALSAAAAAATPVATTQEADSAGETAQESAARWVMSTAAKFNDNATQQLVMAVAGSFPNGVPPRKAHAVRATVPVSPVHTLVGTDRSHQTVSTGQAVAISADPAASKESAAIMQCIKDKQDLTDKIIAARQAARVARTDRMSAAARVKAVKSFKVIAATQQKVLSAAQKAATVGFTDVKDIVAKKSFSSDTGDAVTEMGTITKEVDKYIAEGGPPAAAGLPKALAAITKTLKETQTRLLGDMDALLSVYTSKLMISYPALVNQLINKGKDLDIEGSAVADAEQLSDKAATKHEQSEKDLMLQRAGVEYRCLQEGQCANMRYQQCCDGSGTYTKKVSSWEECAAHCEGKLKEGKQIAGCQMTGLAKGDDRTGSGTCYAQTTCTLKPSGTKCAGSLCKAAPAKTFL